MAALREQFGKVRPTGLDLPSCEIGHVAIDREIRRKLADEILFGGLQSGGEATVEVKEDTLEIVSEPRKAAASKLTEQTESV